jgi:hypothetical protein
MDDLQSVYPKSKLVRNAEPCDEYGCGSKMDMWQTQYLEDGYDYIQWVCQNDDCGCVEEKHLYHNNEDVQSQLIK